MGRRPVQGLSSNIKQGGPLGGQDESPSGKDAHAQGEVVPDEGVQSAMAGTEQIQESGEELNHLGAQGATTSLGPMTQKSRAQPNPS